MGGGGALELSDGLSTRTNLGSHLDSDIYRLRDTGQILRLSDRHLLHEGYN